MPKIKKEKNSKMKQQNLKREQYLEDKFAFNSLINSSLIGALFLTISIFFNGGLITIFMNRELMWDILDVSIKVAIILLFFIFTLISIGNYKDLTGKPVEWKEGLLLFGISLVQSFRNLWVFLFTLIGLFLLLLYFYLVQEN